MLSSGTVRKTMSHCSTTSCTLPTGVHPFTPSHSELADDGERLKTATTGSPAFANARDSP
jgi:hypothetical protein